jgi:diaminopimelate decarboxylase
MTLLDYVPSLRKAATPRIDPAIWPTTAAVDELGRLCVGDVPLTDVADEFRTPAYVLDEEDFRCRIRRYRSALRNVDVVYAGKALLTTTVSRWAAEEGAGVNVSSAGELATALAGGVDPARIIMHGNTKSLDELSGAAEVGVGRIVVDSLMEIAYLACGVRRPQRVLIRVTPDDQQLGFTLAGGHAEAVDRIVHQPQLNLVGLHCHLGSQITDPTTYGDAISRMVAMLADIRARHGVILSELDIGGGQGVPYVTGDPELDLAALSDVIDVALDGACAAERFPRPRVVVEPGRAISARAGVTIYQVVSVKVQRCGRTFVAVDGGMSNNPGVALPDTKYTVALANRHSLGPVQEVTVAGRHCEAGDELARDVQLPADIHPGDLLAVACTGAYQHSMASNYNMVCRPPIVAVRRGRAAELVRRETVTDLLTRDRGWSGVEPHGPSTL